MSGKKYKRIFTIVIDSLGLAPCRMPLNMVMQELIPWAIFPKVWIVLVIPNLQKLGMANLHPLKQVEAVAKPLAHYGKLREASTGKDTMTGHWEMMGLHITKPFKTFTDTGFPPELIAELEKRTGHKVIGNKAASGTAIWMSWPRKKLLQVI